MTNSIKIAVQNETGTLQAVILGIAQDRPQIPHPNNPKIQEHTDKGTLPKESALVANVLTFEEALKKHGVQVYRPKNIPHQDQIFARDIGFVIDNTFVQASMQKENRQVELEGIQHIVAQLDKVVNPPDDATVEGGDVLVHGEYIFVGLSERTNEAGVEFLSQTFPYKKVIPLEVTVTGEPMSHILHLDCAFQPVGDKYAILFEEGFVHPPVAIYEAFGEENIIKVNAQEMYDMMPNVFSISPTVVVVDSTFTRLIKELEARGITVEPVQYREVSKLGGLLRCSTLPLRRV